MRKFKIVKDNNPSLRQKSVDVILPLSNEDKELIFDMFEYLKLTQDEETLNILEMVRSNLSIFGNEKVQNKIW